jgi:hypothetical protein
LNLFERARLQPRRKCLNFNRGFSRCGDVFFKLTHYDRIYR